MSLQVYELCACVHVFSGFCVSCPIHHALHTHTHIGGMTDYCYGRLDELHVCNGGWGHMTIDVKK